MQEPEYFTDEVFVVEDLLSPEECDSFIQRSEALGYEEALVTSPDGQVFAPDVRNNHRVICDDPELAEELWEKVQDVIPLEMEGHRACGVNERFRFYRYNRGEQFNWHQDGPFENDGGQRSFLTLMIYLNDGFEGGETSFNDSYSDEPFDDFQVVPRKGMALFFVHSIFHKGEPVLQGRKYVLRTDVMYASAEIEDEEDSDHDEDEW